MVNIRSDIFGMYKINLIRNIFQYSIGASFYFLINNEFSVVKFLFGMIGFLIAYQSVYFFNDVMDYQDDRRDKFKSKVKVLINKRVKKETLISLSFFFAILGVSVCFFVNQIFGLLIFTCLLLNFFHSSNILRLKKSKLLLPNLFFIEYIKYSLGWFAISSELANFPFLIFSFTTFAYLIAYLYYKNNARNFLKDMRIKIMLVAGAILYLTSIFVYPFKLPMIILFFLGASYLLTERIRNFLTKVEISNLIFFILVAAFILSIFLLTVPSIAAINNNLNSSLNAMKDNITKIMPEDMKKGITSINETVREDIEKISEIKLNYSING